MFSSPDGPWASTSWGGDRPKISKFLWGFKPVWTGQA